MGQKQFGQKKRNILINDVSEQEIEFFRKQSLSEEKYNKFEWTPDQRKRLTTLLNGDSEEASVIDIESLIDDEPTSYVCITSLDQQLSLFKERFPEWDREDSIIFFNSYPDLNDLKVLRRQKRESGLCFMHAPVVLQHYLVSIYNHINKKKNSMEMIDIAKYIATCWKDERLLNYLLHDLGGSSIEFLKEINYHVQPFQYIMKTLPDPLNEEMNEDFYQVCEWCLKKLQSVPGLVSNFEVDSNFASAGISLLDQKIVRDEDPNKKNGHHAMILIGIRPDPTYRYVFLLQNWWRGTENELGRFVIQVSARYLAEAGAQITFVYSDIPEIPTSFPKVFRPYAETSADVSEKITER